MHLEAFHQAEVLWLDDRERLNAWQATARVLQSVDHVLPGRTVKIVPTQYAMCSQAWELEVETDGRWSEVARGGYDSSFEAVWYTDAQLTAGGYVVLMTIPFRTMRFPESLEQRWRIQLERLIPRTSEESYWPAYSQSIDGRLNQAATLNGVRDVSPGRNILLTPFERIQQVSKSEPDDDQQRDGTASFDE